MLIRSYVMLCYVIVTMCYMILCYVKLCYVNYVITANYVIYDVSYIDM